MNLLLQLLAAFFQIGLFSVGGGYAIIPAIQEQVVDKYGWVSPKVFTDIITISQMTPGPLAVNTSTFVGLQIAGIAGAIVATIGCVISGVCISMFLYRFFQRRKNSGYIMEVLRGLKAASLGLIISAAATILLLTFCQTGDISQITGFDGIAAMVFVLAFIILRKWKISPVLLMVLTGIAGAVIYSD